MKKRKNPFQSIKIRKEEESSDDDGIASPSTVVKSMDSEIIYSTIPETEPMHSPLKIPRPSKFTTQQEKKEMEIEESIKDSVEELFVDESVIVKDYGIYDNERYHEKGFWTVGFIQQDPQMEPANRWITLDETLMSLKKTYGYLDLIVMPEHWAGQEGVNLSSLNPIEDVSFLKKISKIIKTYQCFCVLGTLKELQDDETFETSLFFGRNGNYIGKSRKRVGSEKDQFGIFDTELGRVSILVGHDIDNERIISKVLKFKPDIIVNPTHIPSRTPIGTDHHPTWNVGLNIAGTLLEKKCFDNGCSVLRCDRPYNSRYGLNGMGSSQLIGPYRTVFARNFSRSCFIVSIPKKPKVDLKEWESITMRPQQKRSEEKNNVDHRYVVASYPSHSSAITGISVRGNCVLSSSSDCSIFCHEKRKRKLQYQIQKAHSGSIYSIELIENTIYSCGTDYALKEWDIETGKCSRIQQLKKDRFSTFLKAHSFDKNLIWVGDSSGRIRLYDKREGKLDFCGLSTSIKDSSSPIIKLCTYDHYVYSLGQDDNVVKRWDSRDDLMLPPTKFQIETKYGLHELEKIRTIGNPTKDHLVVCTDNFLYSFDVATTHRPIWSLKHEQKGISTANALSDSHCVIGSLHHLNLYQYQKGKSPLYDFSEGGILLNNITFVENYEDELWVGTSTGQITLFSFETNKLATQFDLIFHG